MINSTYKVFYTKPNGEKRLGHVKAMDKIEAKVKAKRFVIDGGRVNKVEEIDG